MSGLKLYQHPQSPFARFAMLVLDVADVKYEKIFLNLFEGEHKKPEYLKLNIQHTVPLLVEGDFRLNESLAISTYVMEKYGQKTKPSLLPANDLQTKSKIIERTYFATGVFFDAFINAVAPRLFRGEKEFNQAKIERLKETLGFFTEFIKETGFLAGTKEISMADLAALAMYSTIATTGTQIVDLSAYPEVAAWAERVTRLVPNYEEANGKGAKIFQEFFAKRVGPA